jgi:hypothetical protein
MSWTFILTVGSVLITEIILVVLHAVNPDHHGPAGGQSNLENTMFLASGLGTVAAILVGATAGSQDVAAGVFRDLVVTGRKRSTLFNVRVPGALAVFMSIFALALGLSIACSYLLAGSLPSPSGSAVAKYVEYSVAITAVNVIIAVGLAAFASSRVVVGVLIAWNAIVSHLLLQISSLGSVRKFIDVAAAEHFLPRTSGDTRIAMSSLAAALILLGWALVFTSAGRWWTMRRDA